MGAFIIHCKYQQEGTYWYNFPSKLLTFWCRRFDKTESSPTWIFFFFCQCERRLVVHEGVGQILQLEPELLIRCIFNIVTTKGVKSSLPQKVERLFATNCNVHLPLAFHCDLWSGQFIADTFSNISHNFGLRKNRNCVDNQHKSETCHYYWACLSFRGFLQIF